MGKELETVIGLEVHVQLDTKSKIFCSCSTGFGALPNTNICPVCCGYPGVLPVLNKKALFLALRVCLTLNCKINRRIYFERKNYFYPDLPKNYQISQYALPLGEDGFLLIPSGREIRIKRVHLEEDAGKLIHRKDYSLVDFNRAGIPLLEIVSYPDINSPQEAFDYLTQLKLTLQYIGASTCDMEKGYLRCDANISLRKKGESKLGTKVELKNMNTFRGVREALEYEVKRQTKIIEKGDKIYQETRLWDSSQGKTFSMRRKEEAHDYRYFPEPDLVDFKIEEEWLEKERSLIGELPLTRKKRILKDYQLQEGEAEVVVSSKRLADFFEEACLYFKDYKKIASWLIGPFLEIFYAEGGDWDKVKVTPKNFSKVVRYFSTGKLNNLGAKKVLAKIFTTNADVDKVIEEEGLVQVSCEEELTKFVDEAIVANPNPVNDYLKGKQQAVMFLVGWVMKKSRGKANPKVVREILEKKLREKGGKDG
ncbi:MAG: Asp-tRNA(Asn)/Glu-tRNA(Gln) amidotransferase subunit GatB [Candidatus Omnitrophica bacterium]|nr:Asp-tRNA(Asn)/Glu-tRNA(Gln) amidotransferase subunit GatB [Candidatus Omnitrophota bacterium]